MELVDVLEEVAMPRAYSADLRERVIIVFHEEGLSVAEVARRCRLGERTAYAAGDELSARKGAAAFLVFVDKALTPELRQSRPDPIVAMKNLSAYKAPAVRQRLEAAGLRLLYLPRYSLDLGFIEPMWSKLKTSLRAVAARTLQALEAALPQALNRITPTDATGYFRHCGYAK